MKWLQEKENGVVVQIYVIPNAKKTEIIGQYGESLKVKISSPPVDGAANREIKKFFSKIFNLNKSKVEILHGEKSKNKKILLKDITKSTIEKVLGGI
jgi:uncharacterized protein (TIGR00251 family)